MCIFKNCFNKKIQVEINENEECSICFEKLKYTKNFTLSCQHTFCILCLQTIMLDFVKYNKICYCPLCRNKICKKDISIIFQHWYLNKIIPEEWIQYNNVCYNNKKNKLLQEIKYKNNIIVYLPLYKYKNINQPLFFYSNQIFSLRQCEFEDKELEKYFSVSYFGNFTTTKKWKKFIKNNFLNFKHNGINIINNDIKNNYNYSKNKMRFFIKNLNNITTINSYNQTIEKGFKFYNQCCFILFNTYILNIKNTFYLINEINMITYF